MKLRHFLLCGALAMIGAGAMAQSGTPTGTPAAVAAKVQLRGEANDIVIPEMRIVRRNDVMVVQADMKNTMIRIAPCSTASAGRLQRQPGR